MKKIIIFGATGSIGKTTINCILNQRDDFDLVAFSFHKNKEIAKEIKENFPNALALDTTLLSINDIKNTLLFYKPDLVINAISGWAGIEISKLCLELNIDLGLANKETFVIAGKFINELLLKSKARILPIDSEHTTLYELTRIDSRKISEVFITASGGRHFNKTISEIENVTFSEAIKHPNWKMGEQISLDSSTMINKCYELIEACYLFDFIKITPIVQKQSLIHSIVMFVNKSYLFNASKPDMYLAIQLVLNDFKKVSNDIQEIDFKNLTLDFDVFDIERWKPIKWFYEFYETKNYTIGPIINIANEYCFSLFKANKIKFNDITLIIEKCLEEFKHFKLNVWEDLNELKKVIISFLESEIKNG